MLFDLYRRGGSELAARLISRDRANKCIYVGWGRETDTHAREKDGQYKVEARPSAVVYGVNEVTIY